MYARNEPSPEIIIAIIALAFGLPLLIVGSKTIAEELHKRDEVVSVGCEFVKSNVSEARCPRKQYLGCGCPLGFSEGCDTLSPDTNVEYCCGDSCLIDRYYGGQWNTEAEEKQYAVSYVACEKISTVFTIKHKNYTYECFCDEGRLFQTAAESLETKGNCNSLYEGRKSCYFDGKVIYMKDPYSESSLVGSGIVVAVGCFLLVSGMWLCYASSECRGCVRKAPARPLDQVEPQPETVQLTEQQGTVEKH